MKNNKIKEFLNLLGSNIATQLLAFVTGILLVRLLNKSDFGLYSYATSILNIFLLFSGMGAASGILQFASKNPADKPENRDAYFKYGIKIGLIFNLVLLIIYIGYSLIIDFKIQNTQNILLAMAIVPTILFLKHSLSYYLRVKNQTIKFTIVNVSDSVLVFIFTIIGTIIFGLYGTVYFKYIAYLISIIIALKITSILSINKSKVKLPKKEKTDFVKFSIKSMFNLIITNVLYSIDILFIGSIIANNLVVANYRTASIIPAALLFIPSTVALYIYPTFVQHSKDKKYLKDHYKKIILYFGLFNLLLTALLIILAPIIINIAFGSLYQDSVLIFRILCIGYFISSTFRTLNTTILTIVKKLTANLYIGVITIAINIGLDWIFIVNFETIGVAIATVMTLAISAIISSIYLWHWIKNTQDLI